jgi:TrpR-related protein YerC/YecD
MAAKPAEDEETASLYDAFLALKTREEVHDFLADLCTPSEIRAFTERWHVARLLHQGGRTYREIAEDAQASTTTVVRVARFLREMPFHGYQRVLERMGLTR